MTIIVHNCTLQSIVTNSASPLFVGDADQLSAAKLRSDHSLRQKIRRYRADRLNAIRPDLIIEVDALGKPVSQSQDFYFNHSHSQSHYALAYSHDAIDLGIDIEDRQRQVNMHAVAQRYFHHEEYLAWQQQAYECDYWLKVWTTKEAVLKASGLGIRLPLNTLNTCVHTTWNFGRIQHPLLGEFFYQNVMMTDTVITVAYRAISDHAVHPIIFN